MILMKLTLKSRYAMIRDIVTDYGAAQPYPENDWLLGVIYDKDSLTSLKSRITLLLALFIRTSFFLWPSE